MQDFINRLKQLSGLLLLFMMPYIIGVFVNVEFVDFDNLFTSLLWVLALVSISYFTQVNAVLKTTGLLVAMVQLTEILHWVTIKAPMSSTTIFIILETSVGEAFEYIETYISVSKMAMPLAYVVISGWIISKLKIQGKSKKANYVYGAFILILVLASLQKVNINRSLRAFPNLVSSYLTYQNDIAEYEQSVKLRNVDLSSLKVSKSNEEEEVYVIVVGESTNRNHMSMYGYQRVTDPLLSKRQDLMIFNDVISAYNYTAYSVQSTLTFSNRANEISYHDSYSIIDVMKKVGFKTYWLSNQGFFGGKDNMIGVLSKTSDKQHFVNLTGASNKYVHKRSYDEYLFQEFDRVLADQSQKKKLIVLHLIGTHMAYRYRYPSSFDKFKEVVHENEDWSKAINEYDNAILYNDWVVNSIIDKVEGTLGDKIKGSVVYFSDHGEEVYDENDWLGHGSESTATRHSFEIPFIYWCSERFKRQKGEVYREMKSSINKPIQLDNFIHSYLYHVGVESDLLKDSLNFIHPDYQTPLRKVYDRDYDIEMKLKP